MQEPIWKGIAASLVLHGIVAATVALSPEPVEDAGLATWLATDRTVAFRPPPEVLTLSFAPAATAGPPAVASAPPSLQAARDTKPQPASSSEPSQPDSTPASEPGVPKTRPDAKPEPAESAHDKPVVPTPPTDPVPAVAEKTTEPPAPAAAPQSADSADDQAAPPAASSDSAVAQTDTTTANGDHGVRSGSGATASPNANGSTTRKTNLRALQHGYLAQMQPYLQRTYYYPRIARRLGHEGRVLVQLTLAADGTILEVELMRRCEHDSLNRAALDAVGRIDRLPSPPAELLASTGKLKVVVPLVYRMSS